MARRPTRPTPEPLDVDAVTVVTAGTALWGVAALLLSTLGRGWLEDHHDEWWIWTCVAGFVLGLAGIAFVRRRRSRLGRVAAARGDDPAPRPRPPAPAPVEPAPVEPAPVEPAPGGNPAAEPAQQTEPAQHTEKA
ncbi:DUF2530 domain-containing protein [Cryptosporangium sp. NPDC048952]|uniref:DUF2530 domain-containing protein n=1 Tax=Cryptosporangium sp. NPDC048952 TaxID=3363961 RepID=UPI00371E0319